MKYRIVLTYSEVGVFEINKLKSIEGNSLVELCAKIPLIVAEILRDEQEAKIQEIQREMRLQDDDIPF